MAAPAVGAELAIMNVVGAMTIAATSVDGFDFCKRHTVTVVAGNRIVGTVKRKVRLQTMVEGPQIPGNRVVAATTLICKVTFVRVVIAMAGNMPAMVAMAPVISVTENRERFGRVSIFYGARTPDDILYRAELERWRGVPRWCGNPRPGVGQDNVRVMDFTARESTEDQRRIEEFLEDVL